VVDDNQPAPQRFLHALCGEDVPDVAVVAQAEGEDADAGGKIGRESCTVCGTPSRVSRLCGRRAQTWRSKPLSPMAWAIGAPWSPRPMNPTLAVCWFTVMIWFSFPVWRG
jgi:hypothetical protein